MLKYPRAPKPGQYILSQIHSILKPGRDPTVPRSRQGKVNELADRKAAEAQRLSFLDETISGSVAAEKTSLLQKERLWKGSPWVALPVQSAIHQLRSGHVRLNAEGLHTQSAWHVGSPNQLSITLFPGSS
jgi:hypothetical protein